LFGKGISVAIAALASDTILGGVRYPPISKNAYRFKVITTKVPLRLQPRSEGESIPTVRTNRLSFAATTISWHELIPSAVDNQRAFGFRQRLHGVDPANRPKERSRF
jgi:hypothetical protein